MVGKKGEITAVFEEFKELAAEEKKAYG
ncbi:MAG: hypothetical protein RR550_01125, partial [Rikenellaceae bacterium]